MTDPIESLRKEQIEKTVENYARQYMAQGFRSDGVIGDNRDAFLWLASRVKELEAIMAYERQGHADQVASLNARMAHIIYERDTEAAKQKARAEAAEACVKELEARIEAYLMSHPNGVIEENKRLKQELAEAKAKQCPDTNHLPPMTLAIVKGRTQEWMDRADKLESQLAETTKKMEAACGFSDMWKEKADQSTRLLEAGQALNAELDSQLAETLKVLEKCRAAITTAILDEDGLDGAEGQRVLSEIEALTKETD